MSVSLIVKLHKKLIDCPVLLVYTPIQVPKASIQGPITFKI